MRIFTTLLSLLIANSALALPRDSMQLVLVTAADWSSKAGVLSAFERDRPGQPWIRALGPFPVSLGRNGLAWGNGLHSSLDPALVPEKVEGDGKSPAGVFPIPFALGFADPRELGQLAIRYVRLDTTVECIDFTDSRYYNRIVDWFRIDELRRRMNPDKPRPRALFRVGFFVGQNTAPAIPGLGSCIYLHLRSRPTDVTSGCTAMDEAPALKLVQWLKSAGHPLFVLLPSGPYAKYRAGWDLP